MPAKKKAEAAKVIGTPFTGLDGKQYVLPPLDPAASLKVPAGLLMDLLRTPDDQFLEWRHNWALLEANNPPADVLSAFRDLDAGTASKIVLEWLGESRGSSRPSDATEEPSSTTSEPGSTSA